MIDCSSQKNNNTNNKEYRILLHFNNNKPKYNCHRYLRVHCRLGTYRNVTDMSINNLIIYIKCRYGLIITKFIDRNVDNQFYLEKYLII